jgi:alpha-1,2-glucosyltransferase
LRQRSPDFVIESSMPVPFHSGKSHRQLVWLLAGLAWTVGLFLAWPGGLIGDEWIHYGQIAALREGRDGAFTQWLTTLPGYHWVVAGILFAFGADSTGAARLVNAVFGLSAVAVFFSIRRRLHPEDEARATVQFALLPVLFPFFFMVYTDALSLALVLGAFLATLVGRPWLSVSLLLAAISVRQNNVIWAGFLAFWAIWPQWSASGLRSAGAFRASLTQAWPYAVPVLAFVAYWWWNGTITYADAQSTMHPPGWLQTGNPYFVLFLVALLMPLQTLAGLREFFRRARAFHSWWLLPLAVFGLFALTFEVDHPYNRLALGVNVRNRWLMAVEESPSAWWAFGLAATAAACAVSALPRVRPEAWLLAPFAALFLAASWMIEPRYGFIPLALYLSMRKPASDGMEAITTALWAMIAVYLAVGIFNLRVII